MHLWRGEIARGRQDIVPSEARLRRVLGRFDWDLRSRVVESDGDLTGSVLVMARPSPDGMLTAIYAAGLAETYLEMVRWGVGFSKATGASITQITVAKGAGDGLESLGLAAVRPWLRMDRDLASNVPEPEPVAGYELLDGRSAAKGSWGDLFNRTFADHWRFAPRAEEEIKGDKPPELCLMAVTGRRNAAAAMSLGEVAELVDDPRPQPIGIISSVGTLPEHRRRGLANWLVAELLVRLRAQGVRTASLYVDGLNPTRAFDAYRKLGFEVTFEAEVWEATQP
jgi:ribosomal protein S18 acetylase RimI-like enzyme